MNSETETGKYELEPNNRVGQGTGKGSGGLKKLAIGILALGAAYMISTAPFSVYTLHKTQWGVERRLGDVVKVVEKPGPHLKDKCYIPFMGYLTKVERLDKRILEYVDSAEKIMTKDHKFIDSDRYCKWRIKDPKKYVNAVRTEERAQGFLDDIVFNRVWNKAASHTFEENQTTLRAEIRDEMINQGNELMDRYGIEIIDIRIKKLNIPEEARPQIHKRMKKEQEKLAAEIRADGEKEKKKITGEKERVVKTLVAEGKNESERIFGEAERIVANTFQEAYEEDIEFYKFWESMKTLEAIADSHPTFVVSPEDNPILDYIFNGGEKPKTE